MSHNIISLADAAEITAAVAQLKSQDAAKVAYFEKEAARRRGVNLAVSGPMTAPTVRSNDELMQAARQLVDKRKAFDASSRGRFFNAIHSLQQPGGMYAFEAEVARRAWDRSSQFDMAQASCIHEIGVALEALAAVPGRDANEARLALAEMLMAPATKEAA